MGAERVFREMGWVGLGVFAIVSSTAWAQSPGSSREYRVLQSTDSQHLLGGVHPAPAPATSPPRVVAKPVQPYDYGWFGAKPQMHWHRQFGNRRSYTQWTLK